MKKTLKTDKAVTAEEIARMADRGQNVSRFFNQAGIGSALLGATSNTIATLDAAEESGSRSWDAIPHVAETPGYPIAL